MGKAGIGVLVLCIGFTGLLPGSADAQTTVAQGPPVSWGVDVAASSAYLWRGLTDIREPSVQPSFWFTFGPVTVDSWFSGPDPDSGLRLREHDLTIEYEHAVGSVDVTAGWTHYFLRYEAVERHAHEVFLRVSREGRITPALEIARGLNPGSGTTVIPSLESYVPLLPGLRGVGLISAGYNHHQWIDESLFTHVEGRGSLEWQANERLTLRPFLGWSRSMHPSVLPSRRFGGLELSLQGRP
jgi:hypothetical protein